MSAATGQLEYGRPHPGRGAAIGGLAGTLLLLALAAGLLGHAVATSSAGPDPIDAQGAIPVGVDHSPAGALAAADAYVTTSYDSVERDPARDTALIDSIYTAQTRAGALSSADAVRRQNAAAMSFWSHGGRNLSLIGARRLDYYNARSAQVSSWNADVFWGPGRPPKQAWVLTHTSLAWRRGRWLVSSITTAPASGPVPASTPQAAPGNDSAQAFGDLTGFTAPGYGAGG